MKATYNKSKIMKLAHHMRKYDGYDMSTALKLAWIKAKQSEFYKICPKVEAKRGSIMFDMNMLANSLNNYYANNTYNGD